MGEKYEDTTLTMGRLARATRTGWEGLKLRLVAFSAVRFFLLEMLVSGSVYRWIFVDARAFVILRRISSNVSN